MITKLQIQKSYFLLDKCHLSLGQIQNHTVVERLAKKGHKPKEGSDLRPIVRTIRRIKGTGIPASTLQKFQRREIKLGRTSARKLASMYDRLMFQKIRAAGANQKEARRLKSSSPDEIKKIISTYHRAAVKIQQNYENSYYESVKAFKRQEREKLKPKKPPKPVPSPKPSKKPEEMTDAEEESFERMSIQSIYAGTDEDTYLDEDIEEVPEFEEPHELKEPPLNDFPTLDEVIFGMGHSDHLYSEWDSLADTSGVYKK